MNPCKAIAVSLDGTYRRSVGASVAAFPGPGRVATSLSGQQLAERRRRWMAASSWRARRTCGTAWAKALRWDIPQSRSLADWRWNMVASSSAMSQSIVSSIIVRPRRITGIACCRVRQLRRGAATPAAAASFIKQRRRSRDRGRGPGPGHWESRLHVFRHGQGLLVLHERQTRFSIVQHPVDRKAVLTARTIARQLGKLPQAMRKTISFDNGTEFEHLASQILASNTGSHSRQKAAGSHGVATPRPTQMPRYQRDAGLPFAKTIGILIRCAANCCA